MDKTFTTWTYGNLRFLAIPHGRDVHVTDERGNWYGGWQSAENFRCAQKRGVAHPLTGVFSRLNVSTHSDSAE